MHFNFTMCKAAKSCVKLQIETQILLLSVQVVNIITPWMLQTSTQMFTLVACRGSLDWSTLDLPMYACIFMAQIMRGSSCQDWWVGAVQPLATKCILTARIATFHMSSSVCSRCARPETVEGATPWIPALCVAGCPGLMCPPSSCRQPPWPNPTLTLPQRLLPEPKGRSPSEIMAGFPWFVRLAWTPQECVHLRLPVGLIVPLMLPLQGNGIHHLYLARHEAGVVG